jgi:DNA-binding XRE family transcriptional regulator
VLDPVVLPTPLRRARERAGLTQAELADRAEVSRQLVASAEAGRHAPAVDAALRVARVLGAPVEALFGGPPPAARSVLDEPLRDGAAVVVGRVGSRLSAAPLAGLVAGDASWAMPDGVVEGGEVRLLPGARPDGLVVVGCDPVLGLCDRLLGRGGGRAVVAVAGTTGTAVAALAGGRAHAALVHGPDGGLPEPPGPVRRVHLARWRVGIGLGARRRARTLEAVMAGRVPLVQREESATSQQALVRAAGGAVPPAAARARGHVDAARHAAIAGWAAVTFEPAARQHGLAFLPLEGHRVELWLDEEWVDHPGAQALLNLLASAAFQERVRLIGGYDLEGCGALEEAA